MLINADTLTNKMQELSARVYDKKPDIVIISEIKPKNARFDVNEAELNLKGFQKFTNLSGKRGICIYQKTKRGAVPGYF